MTRADLVKRWLDGEPLPSLQLECKGDAETALREEMLALAKALDSSLSNLMQLGTNWDECGEEMMRRAEHERHDWSQGYYSGRADGAYRAATACGHLYNYVSKAGISE